MFVLSSIYSYVQTYICQGNASRGLRFVLGNTDFESALELRPLARAIHVLVIIVSVISFPVFSLSGCAASPSPAAPLANAPVPLVIPTYDGSGQVTEPDVIFFKSPWHGFQYWMAFSPYPFSNPAKESPSIVVSNDGLNWQVPDGLENPLALPDRLNYLSDASVFYDSKSDQLWVYYNVILATIGRCLAGWSFTPSIKSPLEDLLRTPASSCAWRALVWNSRG